MGKRTIADFEPATIPHDRTLRDIEQTLNSLGVEFQFEDPVESSVRTRRIVAGVRAK